MPHSILKPHSTLKQHRVQWPVRHLDRRAESKDGDPVLDGDRAAVEGRADRVGRAVDGRRVRFRVTGDTVGMGMEGHTMEVTVDMVADMVGMEAMAATVDTVDMAMDTKGY